MYRSSRSNVVTALILTTFTVCLSACSGGNSMPPTSNQSSTEHLYLIVDQQIVQFTLPLASASMPSVIVSNLANPIGQVVVDSNGNIATVSGTTVSVYKFPLSSSSTPFATFNSGFAFAGRIGFDAAGKLFVGGSNAANSNGGVAIFTPPFSSSSTPSQVVLFDNFNTVIPSNSELYFARNISPGQCLALTLLPPYIGTPSVDSSTLCIDGGIDLKASGSELFRVLHTSSTAGVSFSPLPGSAGITGSLPLSSNWCALGADSKGNVYVGSCAGPPTLSVFTPPDFSTPAMTINIGTKFIIDIATGP